MRMPKFSQLSSEQKRVQLAPMSGVILVVGPPGSGKTVVAFCRADALRRRKEVFHVGMFNRVLARYTEDANLPSGGTAPTTTTVDSWVKDWWRRAAGESIPRIEAEDGGYSRPDYVACTTRLASDPSLAASSAIDWGHLIIDEGQDFCPEFYRLLSLVQELRGRGNGTTSVPALSILADENQRITDQQSTLADIRGAFRNLDDERVYPLSKNYRNTREIAEFAHTFYVGLESGVTSLPERRGEKPRAIRVGAQRDAVERIARHVERHGNDEVGVLVNYKKQCYSYYMALKDRLGKLKNVRVQAYASGYRNLHKPKELVFDRPGTVTVLCYASSKGLEFDTVFLPELQSMTTGASAEEDLKMKMYTMCSRARRMLFLLYRGGTAEFLTGCGRWLPGPKSDLAVWEDA